MLRRRRGVVASTPRGGRVDAAEWSRRRRGVVASAPRGGRVDAAGWSRRRHRDRAAPASSGFTIFLYEGRGDGGGFGSCALVRASWDGRREIWLTKVAFTRRPVHVVFRVELFLVSTNQCRMSSWIITRLPGSALSSHVIMPFPFATVDLSGLRIVARV